MKDVLLLASDDALPYRVMRCAAAAGLRVHVLGSADTRRAHRLAWSRHCASFHAAPYGAWLTGAAVQRVNALVKELGIEVVLPGDVVTTGWLAEHQDSVGAPVFPVPTARVFRQLAEKASFAELCHATGVPHPASQTYADAASLTKALTAGQVRLPAIAKPLDGDGGAGVVKLEAHNATAQVAELLYAPILVQDFIDGYDVGLNVVCEKGRVLASAVYRRRDEEFTTFHHDGIVAMAERITGVTGCSASLHFDVRIHPDGDFTFIECNPRFNYNMIVPMMAGVNPVAVGLRIMDAAPSAPTAASPPMRASALRLKRAKLLKPWTLRRDNPYARFVLDDDLRLPLSIAVREFVRAKLAAPPRSSSRDHRAAVPALAD